MNEHGDGIEADAGEGGGGAPPDTHEPNRVQSDLTREYGSGAITVECTPLAASTAQHASRRFRRFSMRGGVPGSTSTRRAPTRLRRRFFSVRQEPCTTS